MKMFRETLCFDDVLLAPQKSEITSRSQIDLSTSIGDAKFRIPIVSSPMDTVTESDMVLSILSKGGLGIVHRYNSIVEQCEIVISTREELEEQSSSKVNSIAAAVGVNSDYLERTQALYDAGARILCVDVAHGHHSMTESAIKRLKDKYGSRLSIIAGNVATVEGFADLSEWGADAVRIGIGGGSICSTRIQTGHGVPTFQSVLDCRDVDGASIIADGGIKTSGDIVKALAAGADMVMLGSMLAGTKESPGQVFQSKEGNQYKVYRGMASPEAQIAWRGNARSLEGISTTIPYKGTVEKILEDVTQKVKSGLSYTGAKNITELQAKARFIRQTSAAQSESNTHILST